jgi:hypothetical protein
VIFGEGLQNFEKAFFDADTSLDTLDQELRFIYHGTNVPWYIMKRQSTCRYMPEAGEPNLYRWFIRSGRVQGSEFSSRARRAARFSACLGGGPWFCRRESSEATGERTAPHGRGNRPSAGRHCLFGQANPGRAKPSHALGVESAGLAVPADGDPQRERVKAGAKHLASGFDEAPGRVQCGRVEPAHGQRISDREQRGNRLGGIAGEAKHAAIRRRLPHRKVRLMTGKRGARPRPVQSGVDDGPR